MYISFVGENGKPYKIPVQQVAVHDASGHPVALSYLHGGIIVHTNKTQKDFWATVDQLKIKSIEVTVTADG